MLEYALEITTTKIEDIDFSLNVREINGRSYADNTDILRVIEDFYIYHKNLLMISKSSERKITTKVTIDTITDVNQSS